MPKFDLAAIFRQVPPYKVKLLFKQLAQTSLASILAAFFISFVLWPVVSHFWLVTWLSLVCFTAISRIVLVRHFRKKEPEDELLESWLDAAMLLITMACIAWGSLAFVYDTHWPTSYQFAVISVLFIVALGGIPAYATILPIYIIVLSALLLPLSVVFFLSEVDNFSFYGAGLITFGVLLLSIAKRYHDSVILELGKNQGYLESYRDHTSSNDN